MFKKIRIYIIVVLLVAAGLFMLFHKIIIAGIVVLGLGLLVVFFWEAFLKEKSRQFDQLNKKMLEIEEENKRLRLTVEDYATRKLNISEINSVLELGLFEVTTNFRRSVNEKFKIKDKNLLFLGVVNVDFVAKYGVDFRKLKFKVDEERQEIFLANANPEFLSFTKRTCKWEIDEILEFNISFLGPGHWRTNPKLDKVAHDIKEKVRLQVEQDTENGPEELRWIIEPLKNHVERALRLLLGVQGYQIIFTAVADENYISYDEYSGGKSLEENRNDEVEEK